MIHKYKNTMLCGLACSDFREKFLRKIPKRYKMQIHCTEDFNITTLYLTVGNMVHSNDETTENFGEFRLLLQCK